MLEIPGQLPSGADAAGLRRLVAEPGGSGGGRAAVVIRPQSQDYEDYSEEALLLLGKPKPGTVSLRNCVVHVFAVTPDLRNNTVVTARCGATLPADDVQWLPAISGMPCELCLGHCPPMR